MKMKKNILYVLASLIMMSVACEKKIEEVVFEGGTAPVLTASKSGTIPLSFVDKDKEGVKFNWTNPNYMFSTGLSSQTVNYNLEFDTTGANFKSNKKVTRSYAGDLNVSLTQQQVNDIILNSMELAVSVPHNIDVRVVARANNTEGTVLYSNVLKFTATPYATPPKVDPPTNSTLWIIGDASPNGWNNPHQASFLTSHQFTKLSETVYELTIALPGGGGYKLIQEQGNWGTQYHMLAGGTWEAGEFEKKDSDPHFPGPPTAGTYKITMNFQNAKFTAVKL